MRSLELCNREIRCARSLAMASNHTRKASSKESGMDAP